MEKIKKNNIYGVFGLLLLLLFTGSCDKKWPQI